jgi:hypothetical protein
MKFKINVCHVIFEKKKTISKMYVNFLKWNPKHLHVNFWKKNEKKKKCCTYMYVKKNSQMHDVI